MPTKEDHTIADGPDTTANEFISTYSAGLVVHLTLQQLIYLRSDCDDHNAADDHNGNDDGGSDGRDDDDDADNDDNGSGGGGIDNDDGGGALKLWG